jgi:transketolase
MNVSPSEPQKPGRDKLIYSKGHAAIAQYAALGELGFFPKSEFRKAKTLNSILQGHPDRLLTPGIEVGTGSLGQGLSIANGLALANRLQGHTNARVYCIIGDGELQEGQIWEAAMTAANYNLDTLCAFIDRNRLQATGAIEDRFNVSSLVAKWKSFGWHVLEIDGHNVPEIYEAIQTAQNTKAMPTAIIADTIKGKGVSFMENEVGFHNAGLSEEQYRLAIEEINAAKVEIEKKGGCHE